MKNLFSRLQLLDLIQDGEVQTYLANDRESGRNVLIHWLPRNPSAETEILLHLLAELKPGARSLLIEAGMSDGRTYLITENPVRFSELRQWLEETGERKLLEDTDPLLKKGQWQIRPATPAPVSEDATRLMTTGAPQLGGGSNVEKPTEAADTGAATQAFLKPEERRQEPGEFTRTFASGGVPQPAAESTEAEPGEFTRKFSSADVPKPTAPEAGEFTRMFSSADVPKPPEVPPPATKSTAPEPDEFARLFASADVPKPPRASEPTAPEPDEFTRLFPGADVPKPPKASEPTAPQAGEFTRLFASADVPKPPAAKLPATEAGEFTRLFASSDVPKPPKASEPTPAQPPGEFTRMFQSPAAPPTPQRTAPPPSADPGEFTKFFQSPLAESSAAPPKDNYFSKPEPVRRPEQESGEFTRMFGAGDRPPAATPSGTTFPGAKVDATGVFRGATPPPVAPSQHEGQGPSEYTRMFAAPAPQTPAVPASTPAPPKQTKPQPKPSRLPLILILALLAIAALILVFVFVRK